MQPPFRQAVTDAYRRDEQRAVLDLLARAARADKQAGQDARSLAHELVSEVRRRRVNAGGIDALMQEFSLSSEEGVVLMCLAEALLRIPDKATADRLIANKIGSGNWRSHLAQSPSLFVNAATWGLLITGSLVKTRSEDSLFATLNTMLAKGGKAMIRKGVDLAMRMLGSQFVTGQTIGAALKNGQAREEQGYQYSYDMLGEAALTEADATRYYESYEQAIHAIGRASAGRGITNGPGISVKLSALHPRYARSQRQRVLSELLPRLGKLAILAHHYHIGLNIDAEEADRLELSLDLIEKLAFDPELAGYEGLGFVVQAYQKRSPFVIEFLIDLAQRSNRKLMVRLVKGAYWDSEIKRAQVDGLTGYPVYTRKCYTDLSYLICAQKLLRASSRIYPQFATHNAHTLATIYTWAKRDGVTEYEFQCLHGMGESLYDHVVGPRKLNAKCRIYAPVGGHETLLPYLVRRLLENGANSSFVNQIVDPDVNIDTLLADPVEVSRALNGVPHRSIPLPEAMFGRERPNSSGLDLANDSSLREIASELRQFETWAAEPLLAGPLSPGQMPQDVLNPANHADVVGRSTKSTAADVQTALAAASDFAPVWQAVPAPARAALLDKAASVFERHQLELMAIAIREAGKTLPNAISEIREAIDFLRYYAAQVRTGAQGPALGPVVCISPWNFPLAIFTGQISAALAAGNVVLAKPAEQTPLIAFRAVQLLHEAGIPRGALQFVPGRGSVVGTTLCMDPRVRGVIFTGSTEVAQLINRRLASRATMENAEIPFIAETGGQNVMIVDSSALAEQVVQDVVSSAFDSAGQRCSALRVLFLQNEIADRTIEMLKGAMDELSIGEPDRLSTDIGPVIDADAQKTLVAHIENMRQSAPNHYASLLPREAAEGTFVPPTMIEIRSLDQLTHEVFGPVLHIIRYGRSELAQIIEQVNASGFGLTMGVHSRIDENIDFVARSAHVGNIYVNRNIVGAVVGVQPFGGEGKSGTGPKAGGPLYIKRLQRKETQAKVHGHKVIPALDSLISWMMSHDRDAQRAIAETYSRTTLLGTTLVLPGPTGEKNSLSFAPRGNVVCVAATLNGLLNQIAATLACGNHALVVGNTISLPPDLPPDVRCHISKVVRLDDVKEPFQIALIESNLARTLYDQLAARTGALVATINTDDITPIPLWRLVAERALCINTTAAGGNASLMMLAD